MIHSFLDDSSSKILSFQPIAVDKNDSMDIYGISHSHCSPLPFIASSVQAGFPSPAEGYIERSLDINELVVKHPAATFYIKVHGDSMQNAGISSEDILVVDRSLKARHQDIVVAVLDGEFIVKRLLLEQNDIFLISENKSQSLIKINKSSQFEVWGVVTYVIHKTR